MDNQKTSSLLEYALKELKKENYSLKDKMNELPSAEEIEEKEKLLNLQSSALEAAANGIVITDIEGNINWVNNAFTKLTGYTKEEALSQNPRVLKSGVHDDSFYKELWETVISGKVWQGDLVNKRKDGSLYNEEMTITPVKNSEGIVTNFIAIKLDVTSRLEVEKEKAQLSYDMKERIKELNCLNGVSKLISQYTTDQNLLEAVVNFIPSGWQYPEITCSKIKFIDQEYASDNFKETKWSHKSEIIVNDNKLGEIAIYYKEEKPSEFEGPFYKEEITLLQSITDSISKTLERKIAEKTLFESEEKFKAITNSTREAIITFDEDKKIIFWNNAAEKLFGYSEAEANGKAIHDLVIPERYQEEAKLRFKKVTGLGKDFRGKFELTVKRKDGSEFLTEVSVSLTQMQKQWHITGIWRDISNKKETSSSEKDKIIGELKTELTALKSDYNILDTIIEIIPQKVYVKDLNSKFIKVNSSTIKQSGFTSQEDMIGKSDSDLFSDHDANDFSNEEQNIIDSGEPILYKEHSEKHKNGTITWGISSKFPLYNKDNEIIGTFGITEDQTERKRRENELKDSQHKFRQLVNNSTLGIMRLDTDGELIMANPAMILLLGYTSEAELISQPQSKLYSSLDYRKRFIHILKSEESVYAFEDNFIRKDGSIIDVKSSAWTIKDKQDNILYYESIVEDITEQNQVLKILHDAEFKYRMLIDKLSEAVYLLIGRKFEIVNQKFLDLLEINEEELHSPDFNMMNYICEESQAVVIERETKVSNGEEVSNTYEMGLITKNGNEKQVEVSVSYLDFNGKMATQGVVRDLTEKRKTETQIRHLQKMEAIGTLAAGIAHEINTPSQFINDNLSFLKEAQNDFKPLNDFLLKLKSGEGTIEDLKQILNDIDIEYLQEEQPVAINQSLEGIERIAQIVGAMRDFSHSGPKERVSTDLHKLINNSITISRNAWKYIADIKKEFDENMPPVVCLASDLGQVFVNMIVNSSHALEDKFKDSNTVEGEITITTASENDSVKIVISDNGSGMPEKVRKRIFDPFYTTKDVGKGTGQGLAIAYDIIVDKHNGTIEVESEENVGTTFIISLPINVEINV